MEQIKSLLQLLFIKYWFLFALLVFTLVVKFSLEEYQHQTGSHKYYARLMGATAVVSETTLAEYIDPISKSISLKEYQKAATLLHLSLEQVKSIKAMYSKVNMIIAEKDVRYEFVLFADFHDTIYVQSIEKAYLNYIANNPVERRDFDTKKTLYLKEQEVLKEEQSRVDSLIAAEKDVKSVFAQSLFARKADIKIQQVQSDEKFKRYYDVQKIIGFRETMLCFEPGSAFSFVNALKWFFGGLFIEMLVIVLVDKKVKENMLGVDS